MTPPAPSRTISPLSPRKAPGTLRLHYDPASTTCRPIILFASEAGIPLDYNLVDLFSDENRTDWYTRLNPNQAVPVLEHDGFVLTESSAILKYLADKYGLPSYPKELRQRARVNETMDWLNTQLYREFGYNFVYPQLFPHHKRRSDEAHAGTIEWGEIGARRWLQLLDQHWIGDKPYLCGNEISIADYFGSALVSLGELVGCGFDDYPNIRRWLGNMKQLKSWPQVNEVFENIAAGNRDKQFARV